MYPRRKLAIILQLLAVIVLVTGTASIGVAQTPREVSPEAKKDTASQKHSRPAPRYPRDTAKVGTGWLIVNGEFIAGPYEVVVGDSNIKINGFPVYPGFRPEHRPSAEVDSNIIARFQLSEAFWPAFRSWVKEQGQQAACEQAVGFMLAQPIIDTAYLAGPCDLRVVYRNWPERTVRFDLEPPMEFEPQPDGWQHQFMERRVARLRQALTHKGLVISQDGRFAVTDAPAAEQKLKKLQEIVSTLSSLPERIVALSEIIPDRTAAEAIARRFRQE